MARFRKGTTDHDGDGKQGGSLPKGDQPMVKVKGVKKETVNVTKKVAPKAKARRPAKVAAKPPAEPAQPKVEAKAPAPKAPSQADIEAADLEASIGRHPGGMEPPVSPEAAKAALDAQFAHADGVGDPRVDEIAAGLAVRGY